MKQIFAFIVLATLSSLACAQANTVGFTAKLTWTTPVTRVDGTSMPASEVTKYKIKWGLAKGQHPNIITVNAPTNAFNFSQDLPAEIGGTVTVYFVVSAIGVKEGPDSEEVSKTMSVISDAAPSPPTSLKITVPACVAKPEQKCSVLP